MQDWTSTMVETFQAMLDVLMAKHFKLKTTTRRASPWINDKIRSMISKRRNIYNREGRSRS